MRATTLLNRLLRIDGVRVVDVDLDRLERLERGAPVVVQVASRRRRLGCPHCGFTTNLAYDRRGVDSRWRHLDLGGHRLYVTMRRRRLACPSHGVLTQAVPFARAGSGFTTDFEDLVVWLTTRADKTTVSTFARVAWRTVGAMCQRVSAQKLDPDRLVGLVDIGVDEISWRKHHRYLTLVSDHDTSTIVWGTAGKNAAALDRFFDDLPTGGAQGIEAVSMDLGPAYAKAVRARAPQAVICFDPFHVVKVAGDALDVVRRQAWQSARRFPDKSIARKYKGSRWALCKNPADLTDKQAATLAGLRKQGGALWRAYQLKEALRAIFTGDLDPDTVMDLLARWCSRAQRSRLPSFVKAARTIRRHADGIAAAVTRGLANGRHEGLNNKARTITKRSYGFHTPEAALALIMLACGPIKLDLPYHT